MAHRTIMIIGAAEEHCFGIRTAHSLGLSVFTTDGNPDSPGFALADHHAIASTYDAETTLKAAKNFIAQGNTIHGVMTLAADVPFTVAYVAEILGLPGIGTNSALNANEKVRMKECFRQHAVPMPLFREILTVKHIKETAEEFGFPLIVKPVDSRGARGVQLVKTPEQLTSAYLVAMNYSPKHRVMAEQYLPGPQLSTEGFMIDGEAYIPAIFDRNYEYLEKYTPFIVENGGEMPSIYSVQYRAEIHTIMKQAALALGIRTGVVKGDLVIHEGRVKVIEIAARLSGGFFGTVATPVSCGVDLVKANINLCLENTVDLRTLEHKFEKGSAIRFAFPKPGKLTRITGLERVLNDASCKYAHVFAKTGECIQPISNHPARPAVVVAEGSCLKDAIWQAERLIRMLAWEIDDA